MSEAVGRIEEARKTIASLVERYARNRDRYRASTYNEETCRAEFITPLFEAFGWCSVSSRRHTRLESPMSVQRLASLSAAL